MSCFGDTSRPHVRSSCATSSPWTQPLLPPPFGSCPSRRPQVSPPSIFHGSGTWHAASTARGCMRPYRAHARCGTAACAPCNMLYNVPYSYRTERGAAPKVARRAPIAPPCSAARPQPRLSRIKRAPAFPHNERLTCPQVAGQYAISPLLISYSPAHHPGLTDSPPSGRRLQGSAAAGAATCPPLVRPHRLSKCDTVTGVHRAHAVCSSCPAPVGFVWSALSSSCPPRGLDTWQGAASLYAGPLHTP
jgi:hypothetical protein